MFLDSVAANEMTLYPEPVQDCFLWGLLIRSAHRTVNLESNMPGIEVFLWRPGSWVGLEGCQVLQPWVYTAPVSLEKVSEGKTYLTYLTGKQREQGNKAEICLAS